MDCLILSASLPEAYPYLTIRESRANQIALSFLFSELLMADGGVVHTASPWRL